MELQLDLKRFMAEVLKYPYCIRVLSATKIYQVF
jgi:hypothetical protein